MATWEHTQWGETILNGEPVVASSKQTAMILPLKLLIVPDKFKGTLTAREAANAIARGWRLVSQ